MGKGLASRQRAKRAISANFGNLHKSSVRGVLLAGLPHARLPQAAGRPAARPTPLSHAAAPPHHPEHAKQFGKASAHERLPEPPKKEDFADRMPASLRRLLSAKAAAERGAVALT